MRRLRRMPRRERQSAPPGCA
ncbi:hypothetical protein [Paenarthrobacter sp. 2TAF44]